MPSKSKSDNGKRQAKKLSDAQKARLSEAKARAKKLARIIAAEKKARDRSLIQTLKAVQGKGIYDPKSTELTNYRKRRARQIQRDYGEVLDPKKFFFVALPVENRKRNLERAKNLGLSTKKIKGEETLLSKIGLFIRKEGFTKMKLVKEKGRDEYSIVKSGKIKRGPAAGKRYTSKVPLASLDELTNEVARLEAMGESLGPLKQNEYLGFTIHDGNKEGYSHSVFKDMESLLHHINNYQMSKASKINYLRHVEIQKIETSKKWFELHPRETNVQRRKRLKPRYRVRVKEPEGSEMAPGWEIEGEYKSYREAAAVISTLRKRGYKAKMEVFNAGE